VFEGQESSVWTQKRKRALAILGNFPHGSGGNHRSLVAQIGEFGKCLGFGAEHTEVRKIQNLLDLQEMLGSKGARLHGQESPVVEADGQRDDRKPGSRPDVDPKSSTRQSQLLGHKERCQRVQDVALPKEREVRLAHQVLFPCGASKQSLPGAKQWSCLWWWGGGGLRMFHVKPVACGRSRNGDPESRGPRG